MDVQIWTALFAILATHVGVVAGQDHPEVRIPFDDEDTSEEALVGLRSDPSDFDVVGTGSGMGLKISSNNQKIKLETRVGVQCPHSCFCEEEENYASCIGDGQYGPPQLPNSLTRLEMRNFYLPELDSSSVYLPDLLELQLQQCNLSKLHQDSFINVKNLDRLDLSQNRLVALAPDTLRGLTFLKHLDLSSNHLSNLSRPFTHLFSLEHLNLRNNKLKELDSDTFVGLKKVQYVNLDGNMILSVDVAAFQYLGSLAHLILSNNPLSNLARLNFFGSRLQYIDISNICIEKVPQALTQFVRDLRLAKNNIREIHRGDLDSYPYLGLLVLDDNGLEVLEEDALGRHEYLARLWLNGNRLRRVPQSLPISLKALYIEENKITSLENEDLAGLTFLEQLFMQRNEILHVSLQAFKDLSNLRTLDLQANNLTNISEPIFASLTKLESLDLSQNPLLTLSSLTFKGLDNVRILQISRVHTHIRISDNILDPLKSLQILEMYGSPYFVDTIVNNSRLLHSLRGLRELNLMHNDLKILRKDFFTFFPKLAMIKLSANAWNCSDEETILLMQHWMKNSPVNFFRSFNIRCATPSSLYLKPILLLENGDFLSNSSSETAAEKISVDSALTYSTKSLLNFTEISLTTPTLREEFPSNDLHSFIIRSPSVQNATQSYHQVIDVVTSADFEALVSPGDNMTWTQFQYPDDEDEFLYANDDESLVSDVARFESISTSTLVSTTYELDMAEPKATVSPHLLTDTLKSTKTPVTSPGRKATAQPFWEIYNRRPEPYLQRSSFKLQEENKAIIHPSPVAKTTTQGAVKILITEHINATRARLNASSKDRSKLHYSKDLWLYRGDGSHGYVEHRRGISIHSMHTHSNYVILGAGIVAACIVIAMILGGYVLVKGFSRKNRRMSLWENSRSSYWSGRENEDSEGVVVGIGNTGTGIVTETEGTVGVITESHHGLNNRLYLLLQRDSSTGITPDTLPDPTTAPPSSPKTFTSSSYGYCSSTSSSRLCS